MSGIGFAYIACIAAFVVMFVAFLRWRNWVLGGLLIGDAFLLLVLGVIAQAVIVGEAS